MIIKNPRIEISAVNPSQYPNNQLPQIVLVGKSNVGKSSFINTILNRKKLARTSSTPGKTRQINFYNIDNSFYLVDLPGYGYSKMSKENRSNMGNFIEQYLETSKNIKLVVFLLDIRHLPSEDDKLMYNYIIQNELPCICICNKSDKIAKTKIKDTIINIQQNINPLKDITFLPFSSLNKLYVNDTWIEIEKYL